MRLRETPDVLECVRRPLPTKLALTIFAAKFGA